METILVTYQFLKFPGVVAGVFIGIPASCCGLISFAAVMWAVGRWPAFEAGMLPYALALGFTGVIAVAALYRGLALGPVAVVAPVVASYVVITVILVVIVLGERLTLAQVLAASLVFIGVVLTSTDARELRVTLGRPVPRRAFTRLRATMSDAPKPVEP